LDRAIGQDVGQIRDARSGLSSIEQRIGSVGHDLGVRMLSAEEPEELVETTRLRMKLVSGSEMPFSEKRRAISRGLQSIRERCLRKRQPGFRGRRSPAD